MLKDLAKKTLNLGYVGENDHTQIIIDCSEVFWDYPNAVPRLNVTPPRGDKYPASQLVKDGDDLIWTITNSDIIYSGSGRIQLQFVDGTEVIKTAVGTTKIDGSIETTGDAPTPLEDWMNQAEETAYQIALTAKDDVIEQIQDAAEEARESIPSDYTQLSDDVTGLKSALLLLDDIPDTVQMLQRNDAGKVSGIIHTSTAAGGGVVRTDTYVFSENSVVETRTLASGESLTITVNKTTKETTLVHTAAA